MTAMSSEATRRDESNDDLGSTLEFIQASRRPILIHRHQATIREMEGSLSEVIITGESGHPRIKAMIEGLDKPEVVEATTHMLTHLGEDEHYTEATLQAAMIDELCLSRERAGLEVAALQQQCIAIYRLVRKLYIERDGQSPSLDEIRVLPTTRIGALYQPAPVKEFARLVLGEPRPRSVIDSTIKAFRTLLKHPNMDNHWDDAEGLPKLEDGDEATIGKLPDADQEPTRMLLQRDRVRSRFYRQVFLDYMAADEFDPREAESTRTVLAWLQAIDGTPHLYPFMQGQNHRQKTWRVAQLSQKVLQLHEVYARVLHATENPRHTEQLTGKSFRERLGIINKLHYPPLPANPDLTLGALLCPFGTFVEWVQQRVADSDFLIPPDPKK